MKRLVPEEKMSWQRPVLSISNNGTATKGNRYIVGETPTGNFSGFTTDNIAWYDGNNWLQDEPGEGWIVYDQSQSELLVYLDGPSGFYWYYFRDIFGEAGAGGAGSDEIFNHVIKTANETKNNDNTLADDTELYFTTNPNTTYAFEFIIGYTGHQNADLKFKLNHSGTTTSFRLLNLQFVDDFGGTNQFNLTNIATVYTRLWSTTTNNGIFYCFSGVLETSGTGGIFSIQWAQNTAAAVNTTILIGSRLSYKEI